MNLIDINDGVVKTRQVVHRVFQAFFKVASILSAGNHSCHVKLVNFEAFEHVGHVAVFNALSQAIDERRLAHSWLTHMQRVVLILAAKHMDGALKLCFSSY